MIDYGFTKELDLEFEEAEEAVTLELKKEGFGILSRIDVKEKFKDKLGIDFKKYVILGACNPPFAYKAITVEENIGLMLPCNVVLYEKEGKTGIAVIKPSAAMGMVKNETLGSIAIQIEEMLKSVVRRVGE